MILVEEELLKSEKDTRRNDDDDEPCEATFLDNSERDGWHGLHGRNGRLNLPRTVCSCTEQHLAVMGFQGLNMVVVEEEGGEEMEL